MGRIKSQAMKNIKAIITMAIGWQVSHMMLATQVQATIPTVVSLNTGFSLNARHM
ncbi:secreted protein [Candidatus Magnetobacterium bavaricum]|uniref:Secreted protein n=1 Tax=Candidatus Magnetobacterium bavaricum TaxID=29290 RepID=A0A0F3GR45_9BACT|nr:secreted protein [Candidatus Magnetobacterium bavaricum]